MTDKQFKCFYLPAWTRCMSANQWRMSKGRLICEPQSNPLVLELSQVWNCATGIAVLDHRGVEPNDLRHGCHIIALGRDVSSKRLNNKEVNLVVALFDRLADPDSLRACARHSDPTIAQREGLIKAIQAKAPHAYVAQISLDQCGTKDWESVSIEHLQNFLRTVSNRRPTFTRPTPPQREFPKLEYVKASAPAPKEENEPF